MVNSKCLFENCLIPFLEWFTIYDRYIFRAIIVSIKYKSTHCHAISSSILLFSLPYSSLTWNVGSKTDDPEAMPLSSSSSSSSRSSHSQHQPQLLYAAWMPSDPEGKPGWTGIVFVENYTVFYIPNVGAEKKRVFPLSNVANVVPEVVIHGIPDWIYEGTWLTLLHRNQEVLGSSPSSCSIYLLLSSEHTSVGSHSMINSE